MIEIHWWLYFHFVYCMNWFSEICECPGRIMPLRKCILFLKFVSFAWKSNEYNPEIFLIKVKRKIIDIASEILSTNFSILCMYVRRCTYVYTSSLVARASIHHNRIESALAIHINICKPTHMHYRNTYNHCLPIIIRVSFHIIFWKCSIHTEISQR